ncbi:hypothetical protein HK100_007906 [Physocladia obscura]|uniref:Wax synthase domain-containing protein n=1 Tax=Physocladia obscura TaxID=109957 RepID=A0AAD5SR91_9FUNG|nr:hypothetical protein HK100_007906 [Physocladia obscura]
MLLLAIPLLFPCSSGRDDDDGNAFSNYILRGIANVFFTLRFLEMGTFSTRFVAKWSMREYFEFLAISDNAPVRAWTAAKTKKKTGGGSNNGDNGIVKTVWPADRTVFFYLGLAGKLFVTYIAMEFSCAYMTKYPYRTEARRRQFLPLWDIAGVLESLMFAVMLFAVLELAYTVGTLSLTVILNAPFMPVSNAPYLSSSLREFWSRRWNQPIKITIHRLIFTPTFNLLEILTTTNTPSPPTKQRPQQKQKQRQQQQKNRQRQRKINAAIATMASFAFSALLHEYAIVLLIPREWTPGENSVFFLVNGVACVLAEAFAYDRDDNKTVSRTSRSRLVSAAKKVGAWFLAMAFLLVTSPFFVGPFARSGEFLKVPIGNEKLRRYFMELI